MALFAKKKSSAVAALEGEIDALEKRHDALQAKLDASNNLLELPRIDRRNLLINGDDTDAGGAQKIDAAIATAERDVNVLRDVLAEIESRLADARQRLELAREGDAIEKRAAALEKAAKEIQTKAQALEAATDALAIAASAFVDAIPSDAGVMIDLNGFAPNRAATPAEITAAIIGQGLCMSSPSLFEQRKPNSRVMRGAGVERSLSVRILDAHGRISNFMPGLCGEECELLPTTLAADEILATPLRDQAARLRDSAPQALAAE